MAKKIKIRELPPKVKELGEIKKSHDLEELSKEQMKSQVPTEKSLSEEEITPVLRRTNTPVETRAEPAPRETTSPAPRTERLYGESRPLYTGNAEVERTTYTQAQSTPVLFEEDQARRRRINLNPSLPQEPVRTRNTINDAPMGPAREFEPSSDPAKEYYTPGESSFTVKTDRRRR